ncbi:adenylate isopentenyltransferase 5, chloroplastic-like [Euphorbia lathyris]|uniref:adenylate isopentenyltransferase 5, chloroplastic-like n=1 Tax=Euphorbia lathyris TaxID=212925 RepID=UPI0033137E84
MEFALSSMVTTRPLLVPASMKRFRCRIMASQFRSARSPVLERQSSLSELQLKSESIGKILKGTGANEAEITKKKTVFIMGATATGKSKLSVDLATNIEAEIINSDKMQVYKGLDIVTNKIKEDEQNGIPHHLLGFLEPEADFTVSDFCTHVQTAMDRIIKQNGRVPIIVGGSNNYIKELVENPSYSFRDNFETLFLWVDVDLGVLYKRVEKRVDDMVAAGLVEEVRSMVAPGSDYTRGVWRSIGVPEMDLFLYAEKSNADEMTKKMLLDGAISRIKENTCRLVDAQLGKIRGMGSELGWKIHRIDATCAAEYSGEEAEEAWKSLVLGPSLDIVTEFLRD